VAYLRRLADTELRWVLEQPDPPPGPPSGRPSLAPAAQAVSRVRAAAGGLIASGAIDEATATSVLAGLLEALTARSKLPPVHPYKSLVAPGSRRPLPEPGLPEPGLPEPGLPEPGLPGPGLPGPGLPGGPVRLVPVGKPVPFAEEGDEDRLLHLLTLVLGPAWPPSPTPAAYLSPITFPRRFGCPPTRSAHMVPAAHPAS
jgi:GLTT repeat (6 copies)